VYLVFSTQLVNIVWFACRLMKIAGEFFYPTTTILIMVSCTMITLLSYMTVT